MPPASPACRVSSQFEQTIKGNAACLIRLDGKLLTVTHRLTGTFDLPGGTANNNESAQCTAHRETWEETGFNVEVGKLIGESQQGYHFYACKLSGNFNGEIREFPVPDWSNLEVTSIQLVDPYNLHYNQWRFPDQLILVRNMFNQVEDSSPDEP